jgi:hypothetical protein
MGRFGELSRCLDWYLLNQRENCRTHGQRSLCREFISNSDMAFEMPFVHPFYHVFSVAGMKVPDAELHKGMVPSRCCACSTVMTSLHTDKGDFRDKVAALDPAAAPADADSEAGGAPIPASAAKAADRRRVAFAQAAVPKLDPNRAAAADRASAGRTSRPLPYVIAAVAVLVVALALLVSAGLIPLR